MGIDGSLDETRQHIRPSLSCRTLRPRLALIVLRRGQGWILEEEVPGWPTQARY
jgi:hypothetical protein